jgi:hypothetical protein
MTRRVQIILAVFIATQVLDASLTYAGVTRGLASEANPLIAGLAQYIGLFTSLFAVKLLAVVGAFILAFLNRTRLLVLAVVLYWVAAVLPWMFVLGIL